MGESTSKVNQQGLTGAQSFNIIKSGLITIDTTDFGGSPARAQVSETIIDYNSASTNEALFLDFDFWHFAQDPSNDFPVDLDEAIIKCPYSYSQQRAVGWLGFKTVAGGGLEVNFWIDYTAAASGGTDPFDSAHDQYFYYVVYSFNPTQNIPFA